MSTAQGEKTFQALGLQRASRFKIYAQKTATRGMRKLNCD